MLRLEEWRRSDVDKGRSHAGSATSVADMLIGQARIPGCRSGRGAKTPYSLPVDLSPSQVFFSDQYLGRY
jgi:hypothetical protein